MSSCIPSTFASRLRALVLSPTSAGVSEEGDTAAAEEEEGLLVAESEEWDKVVEGVGVGVGVGVGKTNPGGS